MHPGNGTKTVTVGGLPFPFVVTGNTATDGRHTYTWTGDRFSGDAIESGVKFLDPPDNGKVECYVGNPPQILAGTWAPAPPP